MARRAFVPSVLTIAVGLLRCGVLGAMLRLDILEGQLDLVVADPLRATAELRAAQHRDDVIEALGSRGQAVDLGGETAACARLAVGLRCLRAGEKQSLQALDIVRAGRRSTASCRQNR